MRTGLPGLLLLSAFLAAFPPTRSASAQVTVNPGALDLLPAAPRPTAPRTPHRPNPVPRPRPNAATNRPATPPAVPPAANPAAAATAATAAATTAPPKPALPTAPPAIAALPPPAPVPPARPQPPPVIHVSATAIGVASPLPKGVRLTFGPDSQDLNPTTEAALRAFAQPLRDTNGPAIQIYARAAGSPDDPSTARRLALARSLNVRAVLINEGFPSHRIYPHSIAAADDDTDGNRVDVVTSVIPHGLPPSIPGEAR